MQIRWRVAACTILMIAFVHSAAAVGQQPQLRDRRIGEQFDPRSGNADVRRAANLRVQDAEGWQRGDEQPRGVAPRGGPIQPGAPGVIGNAGGQAMPQPQAPFVLTRDEEARLDQILVAWERTSSAVKTYKCEFTRWEYIAGFGPNAPPADKARTESDGILKYMAPDKGMFQITDVRNFDPKKGDYVKGTADQLEHWVCDGKSIFQIDHKQKTRTEQTLPPELQGTAISDGPLPFVFGAKAAKLKQRYWIRDVTPRGDVNAIWLEAHPRYQADAANFSYVEIIIGRKDFMPVAIQMWTPGANPQQKNKDRTVYQFHKTSVNGLLDNVVQDFVAPNVPFHYKKIVQQPRVEQPAAGNVQAPRGQQRSAQAPGGPAAR